MRSVVNKEYQRLREIERNTLFPSLFTDLESLELTRISLKGRDRNDHTSTVIQKDKYYMVGYCGNFYISRPYLMRGCDWEFNVGTHRVGLGSINFLWEIKNMPEYSNNPLGEVDLPEYEDYDDFY